LEWGALLVSFCPKYIEKHLRLGLPLLPVPLSAQLIFSSQIKPYSKIVQIAPNSLPMVLILAEK
jgi:hypothetical protein